MSLLLRYAHAHGSDLLKTLKDYNKKDQLSAEEARLLAPIVAGVDEAIIVRTTSLNWAIPMLVTFTEAYMHDAFTLLVNNALGKSSLPQPIAEEVTGKWIKGTMRGGNPHQWINHLKNFGVQGYPDDLGTKLQNVWEIRNTIIHSSDDSINIERDFSVSTSMRVTDLFVSTTDRFLIDRCPDCIDTHPASR